MKKLQEGILFSPSDLNTYMTSPFAAWMDRYAIENPSWSMPQTFKQDEMLNLLAEKGNQHEHKYLAYLNEKYGQSNLVKINGSNEVAFEKTLAAMESGADVIYQPYLKREQFAGFADFLLKVPGKSKLGAFQYEAWDTKLSNTVKPYFLLQLCAYSWMLEPLQGHLPDKIHLIKGNLNSQTFQLQKYYSFFVLLKEKFLTIQNNFINNLKHMPNPEFAGSFGRWEYFATQLLNKRDSLCFVAGIRTSQIKNLHQANIRTLNALANSNHTHVKGIGHSTFEKLKAQANIQNISNQRNKPAYKVINNHSNNGLSALPPKSILDMFFDIEGHPLFDGGLEYCWGVSHYGHDTDTGKSYAFKDWWAHNHHQEKLAFEGFIDWAFKRWQADPSCHIYHYASYEVTALRKLSAKYLSRQQEVSDLLSNNVLIDLYHIVKTGLLIGEPRYSIKNVEHLYRHHRDTEVASGGDSVVYYERWRESGGADTWNNEAHGFKTWLKDPQDFNWQAWPALKSIRDYNIDDCESTLDLVEWLRTLQVKESISYQAPEPILEKEKTPTQLANQARREALNEKKAKLYQQYELSTSLKQDDIASLFIDLIGFHEREAKVGLWSYFDRLEKTPEALFDDVNTITGLTLKYSHDENDKSYYNGTYDATQPYRTDRLQRGYFSEIDVQVKQIHFFPSPEKESGELQLSIDRSALAGFGHKLEGIPLTLNGNEPNINTQTLEHRICDIAEDYFSSGYLPPLLQTLLSKSSPRFLNNEPNLLPINRTRFPTNEAYDSAIINMVKKLDGTCLCIQGPPGAGKTYTAKNLIIHLVDSGARIGIMSNSHDAILNLLLPLCELLPNKLFSKVGPSDLSQREFESKYLSQRIENFYFRKDMKFPKTKQPYSEISVIGATAFGFAHQIAIAEPVDYLFVDEASQVSLANLIAVSCSAKNIVLMGDQMQLEQPIQGSHPGESGQSALTFFLGHHAVIPDNKGLFLERTYRMHPAVCQPLSEIVYEGKLKTAPENANISLNIPKPVLLNKQYGIQWVPVKHKDNLQSSPEEAKIVQSLVNEIITGTYNNNKSQTQPMEKEDILVVAPYNLQVNLLKEFLGDEVKVGTIDKFQGQEAPVVIISMGVSNVDSSPKGLDFVFNINRLNVAISRAQALAIVVSSHDLHVCNAANISQMEKVNFMCRLINS